MKRAMKWQLFVDRPTGKALREITKMCARARTMAMQQHRLADADRPTLIQDHHPRKTRGKSKGKVDWKDVYGQCPDVSPYGMLVANFPTLATGIVSAICHDVRKLYRGDRFAILTGRKRTREWLDTAPIPVRGQNNRVIATETGFAVECGMYSQKHEGVRRLVFPFRGNPDRMPAEWVVAMKAYAAGAKHPQLLIHCNGPRSRRKWFVDIPFDIDVTPVRGLKPDKIMAVRRDDSNPMVFLACILPRKRGPDWKDAIPYHRALKIGCHNEDVRKSIQAEYRLYRDESARKGHGRKRAVEAFSHLRVKLGNQQRAFNYVVAKHIIFKAERWRCGIIELEDLSLLDSEQRKLLVLGDWPYYQIKSRVAMLCEQKGVTLRMVKPIELITKELENDDSDIEDAAEG